VGYREPSEWELFRPLLAYFAEICAARINLTKAISSVRLMIRKMIGKVFNTVFSWTLAVVTNARRSFSCEFNVTFFYARCTYDVNVDNLLNYVTDDIQNAFYRMKHRQTRRVIVGM